MLKDCLKIIKKHERTCCGNEEIEEVNTIKNCIKSFKADDDTKTEPKDESYSNDNSFFSNADSGNRKGNWNKNDYYNCLTNVEFRNNNYNLNNGYSNWLHNTGYAKNNYSQDFGGYNNNFFEITDRMGYNYN